MRKAAEAQGDHRSALPPVEDPPRDARELAGRHPLPAPRSPICRPPSPKRSGSMTMSRQGVVVLEVDGEDAGRAARHASVATSSSASTISKVASVAQLAAALDLPGDAWRLSLERDGRLFNIAIQAAHEKTAQWRLCLRPQVLRRTRRGLWPTVCAPPRSPRSSARTICSARRASSAAWSRRAARLDDLLGPARDAARPRSRGSSPRSPSCISSSSRRSIPASPICARCSTRHARAAKTGQGTLLFVDEIHRFNRIAAGCFPALCGGRHDDAGRRHDGEPVLRAERRLLSRGAGAGAAAARRCGARDAAGARRSP